MFRGLLFSRTQCSSCELKAILCCVQVAAGSLTVLSIMGKVEDVNKVTGQLTLL